MIKYLRTIIASPGPYKLMIVILWATIMFSSGSAALREVPAKEIQSKIDNRMDVIYRNVSIKGDLYLENYTVESIVEITDSSIEQANFANSIFKKSVDFENSSFLNDSDFTASKFQAYANFGGSRFEKNASFSDCEFSEISFENASFLKYSAFDYSKFNDYSSFSNAYFENGSFPETEFQGVSDFSSSQFKRMPAFSKAHFFDFANFKSTKFDYGADFLAAKFDYITAFTSSKFNGKADFSYAKFAGPTHFGSANFSNESDFQLSVFNNLGYFIGSSFGSDLDLSGSKIDSIKLENTTFSNGSQLILKDADFSKFQTHWSHINSYLKYDGAAYLKLVKNYKDLEWFSDSDDCYYQYRAQSQDLKSWGGGKFIDALACITCGYGVKPDRPVYCSLFLIVICTGILFWGKGLRNPTSKEKNAHLFDNLYYCLAIFFTIPLPDLKPTGKYRYVPVFLRAISWTLFALLIATLGKVMIR